MSKRKSTERQEIICAILSECDHKPLASFELSAREEKFFRARSKKAVAAAARNTAHFTNAYPLPVAKPFQAVLGASLAVILAAWALAAVYLYVFEPTDKSPIVNGCLAIMVVAIGWVVVGGITHRNIIRQKTYDVLFARFSQAQFGDAVHRFHRKFGFDETVGITQKELDELRKNDDDEDWRAAASVGFLLNYFEVMASGVVKGDLHEGIVRENFRGVICFYHDKCWPIIEQANAANHRTFANLMRLKTYYDSLDELRSLRRRNLIFLAVAGAVAALLALAILRA